MGKEREIKLRISDLHAIRRALRKLKARVVRPRLHEHNVLFDTTERALARREQLLRIRTESPQRRSRRQTPRCLVTFKRPLITAASPLKRERHKVREEIEFEVSEPETLATIFEALGLRPSFQYEKFRTTFRLPASKRWARRLLLELDETPIGIFLELEGPANAIDRAAKALGFTHTDYLLANYMTLYREFCLSRKEKPRDMLFAPNKNRTGRPSFTKRKLFS
jgi:adenylate cyclase class 2